MLTDELQMYCLEKSQHASGAAEVVCGFFKLWKEKKKKKKTKKTVKDTVKIPRVEAQDKEMEELHLHCSGSKAHSVT